MQKIKYNIKNILTELKWAVIFSVVALLWMMLEKVCGLQGKHIDYHLYLTNLFVIPTIIVMVMALSEKKKNFYDGQMNYKQGLTSGIFLSVIIAFLSPLTQWITSNIITPEYFPNVIKRSVELGYYKTAEEAEVYFNYRNYVIQGAIGSLVMGSITTSIAMIFIRTKEMK